MGRAVKLEELAEKLAAISFGDDRLITRTAEGWELDNDYLYAEAAWTYEGGIAYYGTNEETREHTGLQEHYGQAHRDFILYHFREALEAMKEGDELSFAYFIVYDADAVFNEEEQAYYDKDGDLTDEFAGWSVAVW